MALDLFSATPALLPLMQVAEAHRGAGLVLAVPCERKRPLEVGLFSAPELNGRPLVTEILRLAAVGHLALQRRAEAPDETLGDFARRARAGDADLLIYLEGR